MPHSYCCVGQLLWSVYIKAFGKARSSITYYSDIHIINIEITSSIASSCRPPHNTSYIKIDLFLNEMEGYLRIYSVHIFKNNISLIKEPEHVKYITSCVKYGHAMFHLVGHLTSLNNKMFLKVERIPYTSSITYNNAHCLELVFYILSASQ